MDAEAWNHRYANSELMWTAQPNRLRVDSAIASITLPPDAPSTWPPTSAATPSGWLTIDRPGASGDIDPQVIIGAYNPQLAHRALVADPSVATLLPCNVVVRTENGRTVIEALDPTMMATSGVPELAEVADDAKHRIEIALEALAGA